MRRTQAGADPRRFCAGEGILWASQAWFWGSFNGHRSHSSSARTSRKVKSVVAKGPGGSAPRDKNHPVFRMTRGRRIGDAIIGALIRAGVVPHSYMLTTRGRKTGRPRTNPVTLVEHDGKRWLVAPYGPVSWVLNARAAGRVTVRRRGKRLDCTVREASPEEAGPILKQYVQMARPTRRYFHATPDARVQEFVAEADRHPVFELIIESHGR